MLIQGTIFPRLAEPTPDFFLRVALSVILFVISVIFIRGAVLVSEEDKQMYTIFSLPSFTGSYQAAKTRIVLGVIGLILLLFSLALLSATFSAG